MRSPQQIKQAKRQIVEGPEPQEVKEAKWTFPPKENQYLYTDENGQLLFVVDRLPKDDKGKKRFLQRHPGGPTGWLIGCGDRKVLYRLPKVAQATKDNDVIFICSGEKDVHTCEKFGYIATTNPCGEGAAWLEQYTEALKGCSLAIILEDNDQSGRRHCLDVGYSLHKAGIPVAMVTFANLPESIKASMNGSAEKSDVTDWVEAGLNGEQLIHIAQMDWKPPEDYDPEKQAKAVEPENRKDTHLALARDTIATFGEGNLIYCNSGFHHWDGRFWRTANEREIKGCAVESFEIADVAHKVSKSSIASVVSLMESECYRPDTVLNTVCKTIGSNNGELDMANGTWTLLPHNRENYRLSSIPHHYDPSAKCPKWEAVLQDIFECDEDRDLKVRCLQEMFGYSLLPSCEFEKFAFFVGDGSNGKSIVLDVLESLLGSHNVSAVDPSQLDNKFQLAYLHKKFANIVREILSEQFVSDAKLKSLTSGELTTAERKFKDPFSFKPYAKHWWSANHMPSTTDLSHGFFRRALVFQFNQLYVEDWSTHEDHPNCKCKPADVRLKRDLCQNEMPGIFVWALEGLRRLLERGHFIEPPSSIEAKKQWKRSCDQVEQFVEEKCVRAADRNVIAAELYKAYKEWAKDSGNAQMSHNKFSRRLGQLKIEKGFTDRTKSVRTYEGIALDPFKG
jgi:P4 family phage/plasmid primase-like protien